ncbi:hypothetical protein KC317_g15917, partial [Hortaea werneckii]
MATVEDDERIEELGSLEAIFPELVSDHDSFTASLELAVAPSNPLTVSFLPHATSGQCQFAHSEMVRIEEHKIQLSHLPPLYLQITLPTGYPADTPPQVKLSSKHNWLPKGRLDELSGQAEKEWEEYGHCQIVFLYIDFLQQTADRGFDLGDSPPARCLILPSSLKDELLRFDEETKLEVFRQGTYDCGICLEPKKGSSCWKMTRCGHVFCLGCLKEFYNAAITE